MKITLEELFTIKVRPERERDLNEPGFREKAMQFAERQVIHRTMKRLNSSPSYYDWWKALTGVIMADTGGYYMEVTVLAKRHMEV